ncbi:glycosyltransferase 87 family protein [Streptomyces sp. DSM 44915]|uniref:Glycosyltransferase 87 family protein n=1 Tax=Streptomyces chisholmiae TaxID=3075540 RepID=A0ABU2JRE3_9ACTN|nr:glycosyltransferase 87 family protein [Streptomyces sp. DSM 44915]MDT0267094.1 glycosyltransferase 87 family protein [Streptomyces sp. DSM 44915]
MAHPNRRAVVQPSSQDEVAAAGSELIGGPAGRRAVPGDGWWTPVRVVALVMIGMFALGMVQKVPCYQEYWFFSATGQYTHACYSDIPYLYESRGFADGKLPYAELSDTLSDGMRFLEYPVLTGYFMQLAAWLTPGGGEVLEAQLYWMVNAGLLMVCAVVIAVCVVRVHRHRPWDGLLVALAPALALTSTINWDLLAGALTCLALLLWSRSRPGWAGVLIGLATAAKLYPVLLLGPLLLLCWRAGRWRAWLVTTLAAGTAWLLVNLPVLLAAPEGWSRFYDFSRERPVDVGSFWLVIAQRTGAELDSVNNYAIALMVLGCAGIALLALAAPRRPRLAQLAFLVVALFILTNKVYSPQYVLWLIPLAALARPRWRDFLIWQACEVLYFLSIWMYLAYRHGEDHQGLSVGGYQLAILLHLAGTAYLCAMVVRDVLRPEHDLVRRDGSDDPGGGVLDGAPDAFTLRRSEVSNPAPSPYVAWGVAAPPPTFSPTWPDRSRPDHPRPPHSTDDVSRET